MLPSVRQRTDDVGFESVFEIRRELPNRVIFPPVTRRYVMEKTSAPFVDIAKIMEQFKLPGIDMSAMVEARRKDIEALTQANKVALEGLQSLAQKQAEILRESMEGAQSAMQRLATGTTLANPAQQGELVQQAFQKALANMQALAEMAGKSQAEAFEIISKRVQQNIKDSKLMKS
jgi:phasin family protein